MANRNEYRYVENPTPSSDGGMLRALALVALAGGAVYLLMSRRGALASGPVQVERSVTIMKPKDEVYRFWRNLENLPRFMSHLEEVRELDERRSHWRAKAPAGMSVEWDAEITDDRPGEYISWRSLPDSEIPNHGLVRFEELGNGRGTVVRVQMEYSPPAGKIGAAIAKLFGKEPNQEIANDLRQLRQMMETGETASVEGQPVGKGQPFSQDGRKSTQGM